MLTSRERVALALQHMEADRVPLDLGGSGVTGMHASTVYKLRQALGLDSPATPVKVIEPYQMLGEIKPDLIDALGVDVVELTGRSTMFGFRKEGWKPWELFDGTPVLVPAGFNTEPEADGRILMYPEGDRSAPPSGQMPQGGFYFDSIIRQQPFDEANLRLEDNLEEFKLIDDDLAWFASEATRLYAQTDKAIFASFPGLGFGDIALVPAPWMKNPKGIRDIEEWYVSLSARPDFVHAIFNHQSEVAIANLERLYQAVGNRVAVVFISGTDFGLQTGPFISVATYRTLFQPFHRKLNDWVHHHTTWKTFIHSCGAIRPLIPHMLDAGFDILNPVQTAAVGMGPEALKEEFGERVVFWGGGVDTQQTLPFGTPAQVREQVRQRLRIFGAAGGFVFNTIHNVQPAIPVENVLAMYEAVREFGTYPLR